MHFMIPFIRYSGKAKIVKTEIRLMVARGWGSEDQLTTKECTGKILGWGIVL